MMVPKFRAWEERYKNYIDGVLIDCNGKVYFDDDVATQDDLDISVERSTGIKDVNGKEIYEGDIVKMHIVALSPDDKIGYVEHHKQYGYSLIMGKRRYRQEYWATDNQAEYEVIGNVHENLELLEAQHG